MEIDNHRYPEKTNRLPENHWIPVRNQTAVVKGIDHIGRCTGNFNYHMIIALVASIYGRKNHISFSFWIDINFSLVNYGLICFVLSLIFILMNSLKLELISGKPGFLFDGEFYLYNL